MIRQTALTHWLSQQLPHTHWQLQPPSGDASFRHYFRLQVEQRELIAVDAPPEKDNNNRGFIAVTQDFAKQGLCVPEILAADEQQGFMLLSFLGETLYQEALSPKTADSLYQDALTALVRIQRCQTTTAYTLPLFDEALFRKEFNLSIEWFCERYLNLSLTAAEQIMLENLFVLLLQNAFTQPQVYTHRDYHCRNLIVVPDNNPGIIDYQDAVLGPITYDLVSLLRDGYIAWPQAQVQRWVTDFYHKIQPAVSLDTFLTWFDLMGIQRHLKILGIYARKYERDATPFYLNDIPRTLHYLNTISRQHALLSPLQQFLTDRILPAWHARNHPIHINNTILAEAL